MRDTTSHPGAPQQDAAEAVAAYLHRHERKQLLRFITCGSVDDGKSTLIGRLLHDTKLLLDDQLASLEADSRRHGTQGERIDFALLVDGLQAEREQGITIDVAYRFFDTERRKFIVADCPGHEQYTRNMATGASTADLAIVLVDARKGLLTQTRRHSYIVQLLGIDRVVLAVNKMDLVDFDQATFDAICDEYRALATQLGIAHVDCLPLSALQGDNMIVRSVNTPWYAGPTLLELLETVPIEGHDTESAFRMPVQWVCRPNQDFRGFAGTVVSGQIKPGDAIVVQPSGRRSKVARIVTATGDLAEANPGQAVTLTLADEIDASRGDVITAATSPLEVADQFAASNEFALTYGSLSNIQFVNLMYANVLGRGADSGGLNNWVLALNTQSRGSVLLGFSESNEFKASQAATVNVVALYTGLLARAPSQSEADSARAQLAGGASLAALAGPIITGAEYRARFLP